MGNVSYIVCDYKCVHLSFSLHHISFIWCKSHRLFVLYWIICILINEHKTTVFRNSVYFILSTPVFFHERIYVIAERCCVCAGEPHWWSAAGCVHWWHDNSCQSTRHGLSHEQTLNAIVDTLWGSVIVHCLLQTAGFCVKLVRVYWTAQCLPSACSLNQERGNLVRA